MTSEVEPKPNISKAVARGDLASVQRIIDAAAATSPDEKIKVVNYARKWTEHNIAYTSEENPHGVAEWYDVTPITLAAMRGHDAIVEYLLQQGADPTLKGCSLDDIIMELSNDKHLTLVDLTELHMNAFDAAGKLTNKIRCCRRTRDLLMVVKVRYFMGVFDRFSFFLSPPTHDRRQYFSPSDSRIGKNAFIQVVLLLDTNVILLLTFP